MRRLTYSDGYSTVILQNVKAIVQRKQTEPFELKPLITVKRVSGSAELLTL